MKRAGGAAVLARPAARPARTRLRHRVGFWIVLAVFCTGAIVWSQIATLLAVLLPARLRAPVGQAVISAGFRGGLALMRILGVGRFDFGAVAALAGDGPAVVACNHLSLIDALLVVSRLPRAVLVTKAELWRNPALRGSMRLAGYLRNDDALPLLRAGRDALRRGQQVVVFPEGTRGDGQSLGPFRPGFAAMAKAAQVPIHTVLIASDTRYLGRGWGLARMPLLPATYQLRVGRSFRVGASSAATTAEIEAYMRGELFP